jgi:3-dehydroquinate synthase
MGEMLHYFIVSSKKDFIFYKKSFEQAMVDKNIMSEIIMRSLEIKKKYIEADEFDQNIRQVFNYGHSFGHAIESLTYYKIPHGIAVSFGMDISNFISVRMGLISEEIRKEIREVLEIIWKGYSINNIDIQLFKKALSKDKKNVGSRLGIILNNGYGNIFKNVMDNDKKLTLWLEEYFSKEVG